MDKPKGKVCVTVGASGFWASWPVKRLLLEGCEVIGTVRDIQISLSILVVCHFFIASQSETLFTVLTGNEKKLAHLWKLNGAKERLRLVKADLMEDGSFDTAIMGCQGVFHTASPVLKPSSNPEEEILKPAIEGTLNVLRSCGKNQSLKRVVLTSSSSTVRIRDDFDPNIPLDESVSTSVELQAFSGLSNFLYGFLFIHTLPITLHPKRFEELNRLHYDFEHFEDKKPRAQVRGEMFDDCIASCCSPLNFTINQYSVDKGKEEHSFNNIKKEKSGGLYNPN